MIKFLKKLYQFFFGKTKISTNFGYIKDDEDERDFKFKVTVGVDLPEQVDLRPFCPPIYNQGQLGSCTANALAAAFQFEQIKQNEKNFIPSRLFIYYNERVIENSVNQDSGAMIRDGIKTMVKEGVCPESEWPYIQDKFKLRPAPTCYTKALDNQVLKYMKIENNSLYELKHCLSDGYPVVVGITIFESFMSKKVAKTGLIDMPTLNDENIGGHAVLIVGYDDKKEQFIVRNSWGINWGDKGYFYLPYKYMKTPNLSSDYWTIRLVE